MLNFSELINRIKGKGEETGVKSPVNPVRIEGDVPPGTIIDTGGASGQAVEVTGNLSPRVVINTGSGNRVGEKVLGGPERNVSSDAEKTAPRPLQQDRNAGGNNRTVSIGGGASGATIITQDGEKGAKGDIPQIPDEILSRHPNARLIKSSGERSVSLPGMENGKFFGGGTVINTQRFDGNWVRVGSISGSGYDIYVPEK